MSAVDTIKNLSPDMTPEMEAQLRVIEERFVASGIQEPELSRGIQQQFNDLKAKAAGGGAPQIGGEVDKAVQSQRKPLAKKMDDTEVTKELNKYSEQQQKKIEEALANETPYEVRVNNTNSSTISQIIFANLPSAELIPENTMVTFTEDFFNSEAFKKAKRNILNPDEEAKLENFRQEVIEGKEFPVKRKAEHGGPVGAYVQLASDATAMMLPKDKLMEVITSSTLGSIVDVANKCQISVRVLKGKDEKSGADTFKQSLSFRGVGEMEEAGKYVEARRRLDTMVEKSIPIEIGFKLYAVDKNGAYITKKDKTNEYATRTWYPTAKAMVYATELTEAAREAGFKDSVANREIKVLSSQELEKAYEAVKFMYASMGKVKFEEKAKADPETV